MKICFHTIGSKSDREPGDPRPSDMKDQPATATHVEIVGRDSKVFGFEDPAGVKEPIYANAVQCRDG